jgi:hypothetical protein
MTTEYDKLVAEQANEYNDTDEVTNPGNYETTPEQEDGGEYPGAVSEDVDTDYNDTPDDDEVEETAGEAVLEKTKTTKEPAKPKRGDLPEGYVTPVGLAKLLTKEGLGGQDEEGNNKVVPPQVVYSYIKNAPKDHPFPLEDVEDSNGQLRPALVAEAGLQWWREKNERVAARKANAADKASKQAATAKAREQQNADSTTEDEGKVTEEAE